MTAIPMSFAANNEGTNARMGLYFKVSGVPDSDICLVDLKSGTTAFWRLTLQSGGSVLSEFSFSGAAISLQLTSGMLVNPNAYYWAACTVGGGGSNLQIIGQLWAPGGVTDGLQSATNSGAVVEDTVPCDLGWGVPLSSPFAPFPNSGGNEMSVLLLFSERGTVRHVSDAGVIGPPTTDPVASSYTAAYLCHQPLGPASSIVDSSGHGYDLLPGPNGATIVADGPY